MGQIVIDICTTQNYRKGGLQIYLQTSKILTKIVHRRREAKYKFNSQKTNLVSGKVEELNALRVLIEKRIRRDKMLLIHVESELSRTSN